ncbi:MAG: BatA domain-containing protein, partial [Chitinispirillia bacterium]
MNFSFSHPEYLWVLCLIIIPLIIHFLRQKRILRLDFSSTRFLRDIAVKANQINRLKNLLLLITRILILIILVLLFAQPYNKKNPFRIITGSNTALYCWVDPTISMSYKHTGETIRQHACNSISYIDSILPTTSELYCYNGNINNFSSIRNIVSSTRITEVCTSLRHGHTDLNDMIYKFLKDKNNDSRSPILILFSDFPLKDKKLFEDFLNSTNVTFPILCVNMVDEDPWNYSIDNPYILLENGPVLKCSIKSKGRDLPDGEVVVELGSIHAGNKPVTLQKNDSLNISIDISQNSRIKRGNIKITADDPYSIDNIAFFIHNNIKRKKILIISDSDASLPISAVFQSISTVKWFPPVIKKSIDVSYNDLDSSDIIVLSSIKEPTEILSILWSKTGLSEKLVLFSPYIGDLSNSLNNVIFNHLKTPSRVNRFTSINPLFPILPDTVSNLWQGF